MQVQFSARSPESQIPLARRGALELPGALEEQRREVVRRIHSGHVEAQFRHVWRRDVSEWQQLLRLFAE